jgi:hypothetical protein
MVRHPVNASIPLTIAAVRAGDFGTPQNNGVSHSVTTASRKVVNGEPGPLRTPQAGPRRPAEIEKSAAGGAQRRAVRPESAAAGRRNAAARRSGAGPRFLSRGNGNVAPGAPNHPDSAGAATAATAARRAWCGTAAGDLSAALSRGRRTPHPGRDYRLGRADRRRIPPGALDGRPSPILPIAPPRR